MNKKLNKKENYKVQGYYLKKFDELCKTIKINIDNMDYGAAKRESLKLRHYIDKLKEEITLKEVE